MNSPDMPTDLPSALHAEKLRLEREDALREYKEFWLAESKRLTEEIQKEREAHGKAYEKKGFRYTAVTAEDQDDGGATEEAPGENQEQSGSQEDSGRG